MIKGKCRFISPHPRYPQYLYILDDVLVGRHGILLDSDGQYFPEINQDFAYWCRTRGNVDDIIAETMNRDCVDVDETCVSSLNWWEHHTFSHIWDQIQPLKKVQELNIDHKLLFHGHSKHTKDLPGTLNAFGYVDQKRIKCDVKKYTYKISKLIYSSVCAYPGRLTEDTIPWIRNKYLQHYGVKSNNDVKLYLHRRGRRSVKNAEVVIDQLSKRGFIVVDGSEPMPVFLNLFHNASMIVAPHGSMLKNIIFNKDYSRLCVVEFCPDNRPDDCQCQIGEKCGINYQWVVVPGDDKYNIEIDVSSLSEYGF